MIYLIILFGDDVSTTIIFNEEANYMFFFLGRGNGKLSFWSCSVNRCDLNESDFLCSINQTKHIPQNTDLMVKRSCEC